MIGIVDYSSSSEEGESEAEAAPYREAPVSSSLADDREVAPAPTLISADNLFTRRVDTIHAKSSHISVPVLTSTKPAGLNRHSALISAPFPKNEFSRLI
jgi:hypothetical protein